MLNILEEIIGSLGDLVKYGEQCFSRIYGSIMLDLAKWILTLSCVYTVTVNISERWSEFTIYKKDKEKQLAEIVSFFSCGELMHCD